jgi:ferrochelatase
VAPIIGVLVMAYGGPNSLDEVEPYLRDVRGYRETPRPVIEAVRARYQAIGGRSPIRERTEAQARALQQALDPDGSQFTVVVGMRHWHPYVSAAMAGLAGAGVRRAVGLVMAPHYSKMSIGYYVEAFERARNGMDVTAIHEWHLLDGYLGAVTTRVRAAVERFPAAQRASVPVMFTAHSLPERILQWRDPYPDQLAATSRAVVERLGLATHRVAYQSAAMTPDPWLGPDASVALGELAALGHRQVVIAPLGFTCEHVEVLYDVDIALQRRARDLGVRLERADMVNDASDMMAGLAGLVKDAAARQSWL